MLCCRRAVPETLHGMFEKSSTFLCILPGPGLGAPALGQDVRAQPLAALVLQTYQAFREKLFAEMKGGLDVTQRFGQPSRGSFHVGYGVRAVRVDTRPICNVLACVLSPPAYTAWLFLGTLSSEHGHALRWPKQACR